MSAELRTRQHASIAALRTRRASRRVARPAAGDDRGRRRDERSARCGRAPRDRAPRRRMVRARRRLAARRAAGGGTPARRCTRSLDRREAFSRGRRLRERTQSCGGSTRRNDRTPAWRGRAADHRLRIPAARVLPRATSRRHAHRSLPAPGSRRSAAVAGPCGSDGTRRFHGDGRDGRACRAARRRLRDTGVVPDRLRDSRPARCRRGDGSIDYMRAASAVQCSSHPPRWASFSRCCCLRVAMLRSRASPSPTCRIGYERGRCIAYLPSPYSRVRYCAIGSIWSSGIGAP